MDRTEDK
jgi:hypothetical protein